MNPGGAPDTPPGNLSESPAMQALIWIRRYAFAVFFLVLAGGVILRPGAPRQQIAEAPAAAAQRVTPAGLSF